jgi:integrase
LPGGGETFAAVAQDYLDKTEIRRSSRNTYRDLLNIYWLDTLADRPVAAIRTRELREIDRNINWPSPGLRQNALTALRRVFDHAVDEELVSENPASALRVRRIQRDREPDPYSVEERNAILRWVAAHADGAQRLAVEIAFGTGMRTGEILALQARDWDGERLRVIRSRVRGEIVPTKTSEVRRVLVDRRLRALLDDAVRDVTGEAWLLTTSTGAPYLYPGKAFRGYRAAVDALELRKRTGPYPWRHTYASIALVTPGVSLKWVANQLGHSVSMLEKVYARWIESDADAAQMAALEAGWEEVGQELKLCDGQKR